MNNKYNIDYAKKENINGIVDIASSVFNDNVALFIEKQLYDYFDSLENNCNFYDMCFFVVRNDLDEVIGFSALSRSSISRDIYNFMWSAVKKECQGQGIGALLIEARLSYIKEKNKDVDLDCIFVKTKYSKLYLNYGFESISEFKNGKKLMKLEL